LRESLEAERSASRVDLDFDFGRVFSGVASGELFALAFIADTDNTSGRVSVDPGVLVTGFKSQEKRHL